MAEDRPRPLDYGAPPRGRTVKDVLLLIGTAVVVIVAFVLLMSAFFRSWSPV